MASASYKKIKDLLKSTDLPKVVKDDFQKELESHFYEKEHELRFSGLKEEEIQKQITKDFGNEELIVQQLNFVHKKSFYSFIKNLMQNKNKPSIFITIALFIPLVLFYQSTMLDMATVLTLSGTNQFDAFVAAQMNTIRIFVLGVIFIFSFALAIRLFKGQAIIQKIVASLLCIVICVEIGITYSFLKSLPDNGISDQELIENPYTYDEPEEADWVGFYNEKDGYQFNLPLSYLAYRQDGTSDLAKYFTPPHATFEPEASEIVAFGPAFSSDAERIDINIFDLDNSPDKKTDETWPEYYLRSQLKDKKYQMEPVKLEGFFGNMPPDIVSGLYKIHLSEPLKMRQDILIQEYNNRLYTFLHDAKNSLHKEILGIGVGVHVPEEKIHWVTFDVPNCPFTLQIPDYWEEGYIGKNGDHVDIDKCEGLAFIFPQAGGVDFRTQIIETQDLKSSFLSQGLKIKAMGDTQWQDLPAKRFLVQQQPLNEEVGFIVEFDDEVGFALELKPNKWLLFYHAPMDKISERVLNSLKIKTSNETPQEN